MSQPIEATHAPDTPLADTLPAARADLHALVEAVPEPILEEVCALLRLLLRLVTSNHASAMLVSSGGLLTL